MNNIVIFPDELEKQIRNCVKLTPIYDELSSRLEQLLTPFAATEEYLVPAEDFAYTLHEVSFEDAEEMAVFFYREVYERFANEYHAKILEARNELVDFDVEMALAESLLDKEQIKVHDKEGELQDFYETQQTVEWLIECVDRANAALHLVHRAFSHFIVAFEDARDSDGDYREACAYFGVFCDKMKKFYEIFGETF